MCVGKKDGFSPISGIWDLYHAWFPPGKLLYLLDGERKGNGDPGGDEHFLHCRSRRIPTTPCCGRSMAAKIKGHKGRRLVHIQ